LQRRFGISKLTRRLQATSVAPDSAGRSDDQSGGGEFSDLKAAVPYYGNAPASRTCQDQSLDGVSLRRRGSANQRRHSRIEAALKKAGIEYQIHMYAAPSTFHNDSNSGLITRKQQNGMETNVAFFKQKL